MAGEDQGQPCTQTRWERGRLQAQSKAEGPGSWRLQRSLRALTSRATRGAGDRVQSWAGPAVPRRGWPSGRGLPAQGLGCSVYCEGVGEPWKGPRQGQFWTTVEDGQEVGAEIQVFKSHLHADDAAPDDPSSVEGLIISASGEGSPAATPLLALSPCSLSPTRSAAGVRPGRGGREG